jgi:Lrp/AsnC family transcriptional regulator, leucine-responsive regulatory protein
MDEVDKAILYALDVDCRTPFRKIAQKLSLHTQSVISRVERLERDGILKGYSITTNMYPLGYVTQNIFMQFSGMTQAEMRRFEQCIKDEPAITFGVLLLGSYNLMLSVKTKTFFELEETLTRIEKGFGHLILRIDICPRLKSVYLPRKYLLKKVPAQIPIIHSEGKSAPLELSALDLKILASLSKNARRNIVEIAKEVQSTHKTVREHMRELQRSEIIKRFLPLIDTSLLGYTWFIGVLKLHKKEKKAMERLLGLIIAHPNITFLTEGRGRWDILIDMHVQNAEDCNTIMGKIRTILKDDIAEEQVVTVLRRLKQEFIAKREV